LMRDNVHRFSARDVAPVIAACPARRPAQISRISARKQN
jgi:hypothetical protein